MQILFITVCDTSGTRIRKQLFYFISVITFQQISITFQFGQEGSDFLSISSPLTASQQPTLLLPSPSTAISHPKAGCLGFNCREHMGGWLAFAHVSLCNIFIEGVVSDCPLPPLQWLPPQGSAAECGPLLPSSQCSDVCH